MSSRFKSVKFQTHGDSVHLTVQEQSKQQQLHAVPEHLAALQSQIAQPKSTNRVQSSNQSCGQLQVQPNRQELAQAEAAAAAAQDQLGHFKADHAAQHSSVSERWRRQLQSSQQQAAKAEAAAALAEEELKRSQLEQDAKLQQQSQHHSEVLRQVQDNHEAQMKAQLRKLAEQHSDAMSQLRRGHEAQAQSTHKHHEVCCTARAVVGESDRKQVDMETHVASR